MGLPVLLLAGPTGAGKSAWALRLAETAAIEIISVDSALVYRGLDIGTAKPSPAERARVPHHLIDICDPTESYSAGRFLADALALIATIHGRGRVPLLVGGTMLYFRALLRGLAHLPQASPEQRQRIDARAAREGWPALHVELTRLDPEAGRRISPNDPQRIQRALEVCYSTGRPLSDLQRQTVSPLAGVPLRQWALVPGARTSLHERLERRFYSMLADGFLEEVRSLYARGDLNAGLPALRAVGYRQLWAHLQGKLSLEEATRLGLAATRQLVKRQLTWLRSERSLQWVDPDSAGAEASWNRDVVASLRELGL